MRGFDCGGHDTNLAITAGADWRGSQCGSRWNAVRHATVAAAHAVWVAEHAAASTIAANAGHESSIVVQRVKDMKADEGFNALTERYEDLVAAGVIDPVIARTSAQR